MATTRARRAESGSGSSLPLARRPEPRAALESAPEPGSRRPRDEKSPAAGGRKEKRRAGPAPGTPSPAAGGFSDAPGVDDDGDAVDVDVMSAAEMVLLLSRGDGERERPRPLPSRPVAAEKTTRPRRVEPAPGTPSPDLAPNPAKRRRAPTLDDHARGRPAGGSRAPARGPSFPHVPTSGSEPPFATPLAAANPLTNPALAPPLSRRGGGDPPARTPRPPRPPHRPGDLAAALTREFVRSAAAGGTLGEHSAAGTLGPSGARKYKNLYKTPKAAPLGGAVRLAPPPRHAASILRAAYEAGYLAAYESRREAALEVQRRDAPAEPPRPQHVLTLLPPPPSRDEDSDDPSDFENDGDRAADDRPDDPARRRARPSAPPSAPDHHPPPSPTRSAALARAVATLRVAAASLLRAAAAEEERRRGWGGGLLGGGGGTPAPASVEDAEGHPASIEGAGGDEMILGGAPGDDPPPGRRAPGSASSSSSASGGSDGGRAPPLGFAARAPRPGVDSRALTPALRLRVELAEALAGARADLERALAAQEEPRRDPDVSDPLSRENRARRFARYRGALAARRARGAGGATAGGAGGSAGGGAGEARREPEAGFLSPPPPPGRSDRPASDARFASPPDPDSRAEDPPASENETLAPPRRPTLPPSSSSSRLPPLAPGSGARPNGACLSAFKRARSTSAFKGVTMHRRTRRWEAHIWVKETGKQLYLGGFESELDAARAFDCAAVKFKGRGYGGTNFDVERTMREDVKRRIEDMSREEVVRAVRDRTLP